ncbi:hypothetical protein P280DRAFT_510450 [Massarina eburnea CBS 473.64]|uniref:Uncharacterized protein n=1 Tax=Massarina eburnea CBS 473.64 TaxID=1395130 RepID=A0A6A6RMW4_9PLEO|nr:hypothetical protein P280DRAFT_510450 [Massarina eburnea CBS 473.64]
MSSRLTQLPNELLYLIFDQVTSCVDEDHDYGEDLKSLRLTSKEIKFKVTPYFALEYCKTVHVWVEPGGFRRAHEIVAKPEFQKAILQIHIEPGDTSHDAYVSAGGRFWRDLCLLLRNAIKLNSVYINDYQHERVRELVMEALSLYDIHLMKLVYFDKCRNIHQFPIHSICSAPEHFALFDYLRVLTLRGITVGDYPIASRTTLYDLLISVPRLERLQLEGDYTDETGDLIAHITATLPHLRHLDSLDLSNMAMTTQQFIALITSCPKSLRSLKLIWIYLSTLPWDVAFDAMATHLDLDELVAVHLNEPQLEIDWYEFYRERPNDISIPPSEGALEEEEWVTLVHPPPSYTYPDLYIQDTATERVNDWLVRLNDLYEYTPVLW